MRGRRRRAARGQGRIGPGGLRVASDAHGDALDLAGEPRERPPSRGAVDRDERGLELLGKGGQAIKAIGAQARKEIAMLIEKPVHLFLFVKVREGWADDPARYREMGLEFPKD